MHKFNVINKSKLDSPKRREVLPVQEIMYVLGMAEEDIVADIGCGTGYFTFAIAEAVGSRGTVYAMDIEPGMLEDVQKKITETGIENIIPLQTNEYELMQESEQVHTAFLCTVMHEVKMREKFLKEVNRILSHDGEIIILEWIKKDSDFGPPSDHRLDKKVIKRNLLRTGFTNIEITDFNEHFYILRAKKA